MKSMIRHGFIFMFCLLMADFSFGQKISGKSTPIPENINSILRPFCYSCHGPEGGRLPHSKLNFTRWDGYSPSKQAEKAAAICSSMKKGTMPTKLWKEQNPALKLTEEQINIVCSWSGTLKMQTEKNSNRPTGRKQRTLLR